MPSVLYTVELELAAQRWTDRVWRMTFDTSKGSYTHPVLHGRLTPPPAVAGR